ncbi:hypothetical protein [Gordonia sp. 852002-10350_SCH5691597]|nr:hypothetical protein [Gordonia sp. 852002-10350_SCH5691597]
MKHIVWWLDGNLWRSVKCANRSIALLVAAEYTYAGFHIQIKVASA